MMVPALFLLGLLSYLLQLVLNIILARHLSMELFGDAGIAVSLLTTLSAFLLLGSDDLVRKHLPLIGTQGTPARIRALVSWNAGLLVRVFLLYYLVLAAVCLVFFNGNLSAMISWHILVYFLLLAPLAAIARQIITYHMAMDRILLSTTLDLVVRYILLIAGVLAAVLVAGGVLTGGVIFLVWLVGLLLLAALSLIPHLLRVPGICRQAMGILKTRCTRSDARAWSRDARGLVILGTIFPLAGAMDRYVLEVVDVHESMVGLYMAVVALTAFFFVFPSATSRYVIPAISRIHTSQSDRAELQRRIDLTNRFNGILGTGLAIILIVFAVPLLDLFGEGYAAAAPALIVITIAALLVAIADLPGRLLNYTGYEREAAVYVAVQIAITIVLGSILCLRFGLIGLSAAVLASTALRLYLCLRLVRKTLPVRSLTVL